MIKSMTGFGRAEEITGDYKLSIEIKSVNHRYLDLNIKMPRRYCKKICFKGQSGPFYQLSGL